jgi:DNA-binding FadR family transcriptional regulator
VLGSATMSALLEDQPVEDLYELRLLLEVESAGRAAECATEHGEIYRAIAARDAGAAREAMRRHILGGIDALREARDQDASHPSLDDGTPAQAVR